MTITLPPYLVVLFTVVVVLHALVLLARLILQGAKARAEQIRGRVLTLQADRIETLLKESRDEILHLTLPNATGDEHTDALLTALDEVLGP